MIETLLYWMLATQFAHCLPLNPSPTEKAAFINLPVPVTFLEPTRTFHVKYRRRVKMPTISEKDYALFNKQLKNAFALYPVPLLKKHLKAIVPVHRFAFDDYSYGGSYSNSKCQSRQYVYLAVGAEDSTVQGHDFSPEFIEEAFHHEFSSLLMHAYPFPEQAWQSAAGVPFSYAFKEGGIEYLKKARKQELSLYIPNEKKRYQLGILSDYGMSSLEEDFNVYSELLMTKPEHVKQLSQKYPAIARKVKLWHEFYRGIDPAFEHTRAFQIFLDP